MTATHDLAGTDPQTLTVSHNGTEIHSETGDGWTKTERDDIALQALEDETVAEFEANGITPRLLELLRDAIFENIELT